MGAKVDWQERLTPFGATLLSEFRKGSIGYVHFVCACGEVGQKSKPNLASGQQPLCVSCSRARMSSASDRGDSKYRAFFESKDATFIKVAERGRSSSVSGRRPRLTLLLRCSCGTEFTSQWENLVKRDSNPLCMPCMKALWSARRGPLHPSYDSTLSPEDRAGNRCEGIDKWYEDVRKAWGFTCAITGAKGCKLSSHHLYDYKFYPDLRLTLANGVAISTPMHKEFHRIYGKKGNTLAQFREFFYLKTGRTFHPLGELPEC